MEDKLFKSTNRIIDEEKVKRYRSLLADKWGKKYFLYRQAWNNASDNFKLMTDFPMHIDVDPVDSCNLHCTYCCEEHGYIRQRTYKKMPEDMIDALFKEIELPKGKDRLGGLGIGTLGEPFLMPETVYKIFEKANRANVMETFIHTNAILMTKDIFRNLVDLDLTYLFFSLDAAKPETYAKMRGGDFSKAMENIMNVVEYKKKNNAVFPVLRVSFLETKFNVGEEGEFVGFWRDKVDFIDLQPAWDFTTPAPENIRYACNQPFQRMTVGVQGEMGTCCVGYIMRPDFCIGHFPEMSVYEAWNSKKANDLRAAQRMKKFEDFPACFHCLTNFQKDAQETRKV